MKRSILLSIIAVLAFAPAAALAAVVRTGEAVSVAQDAIVPGDFYVMGGDVTISGLVEGDVYMMGGTLTVNGTVEGDILALGGTVAVHGTVGDDVRAAGGKVVVANAVKGDVAVAGGSLSTLSTAVVGGDVLFYGGRATIAGSVAGEVHARGETLAVEGDIGSVDATLSGPLSFSGSARVAGDVSYGSPSELVRTPETVIDGDIARRELMETNRSFDMLLPYWFMLVFSVLAAVFFLRERLARIVSAKVRPWVLLLSGFGILVLAPVASALLFASVLGVIVGGLLLMAYLALMLVALVVMHVFAGAFVAEYVMKKDRRVTPLYALLGVVVIQAVLLVPFIGGLAVFLFFLYTLGLIGHHIYSTVRL